jgi:hypothetical protein
MGTTLTGTTIKTTYDSLIKVTDNGPIGSVEKTLTDGLGNDSAFALGTLGVKLTGLVKDGVNSAGSIGQALLSTGSGVAWSTISSGLEGSQYVVVKGDGTASENGQALLDGYTEAAAKAATTTSVTNAPINFAQNLGGGTYRWFVSPAVPGFTADTNYQASYGGVDYIFRISNSSNQNTITVYVTDLAGTAVSNITFSGSVPVLSSNTIVATLLIAPGYYTLPSTLVINHRVSVCSLSGERDVYITGDVQVSSGANYTTTFISGLSLRGNQFIVDANLQNITCRNIYAGDGSFNTGSISGRFIDCFGGQNSFGSGSGQTASGTFVGCDAKKLGSTNGFSFGNGSASTTGYFYRCGSLRGNNDSDVFGGGYANFGRSATSFRGVFVGCLGQNQSFGSVANSIDSESFFYYCQSSGSGSFGNNAAFNGGYYYYCTGKTSCFGGNNDSESRNAFYYYCIADSTSFGSQFGQVADESVYIGCVARGDNCFGKVPFGTSETRGRLFNCTMAGAFAPIAGNGKIINCLDGGYYNAYTFNLVNNP